ncbi:aldo/keto reductase [Planosporangium thailandense]|uniref:Aldo/keto reductase n=1 Tax=Planosporangium thailandense TaxID=765197 RepID=A0ABX0Y4V1_9ACTN|nr:aldo/keto reductase [Planosporangium thailandense]NJC73439.1 aldo/keto reductase [Planosporangium thailandense]
MASVSDRRPFGRAGFEVTAISYGAAPIGNIFRPIVEADAQALIAHAWDAGVRYFDTAPMYGHGLSEHRLGHGLLHRDRDEFVISTKVGRTLVPRRRGTFDTGVWVDTAPFEAVFDYSYDATMRQVEDSLQRMCTDRVEIAFIHDIDAYTHGPVEAPKRFAEAMEGSYKALLKLREEGVIRAIGVGVNEVEPLVAAAKQGDFDCFLVAGRYTLLDQDTLDEFLPICEERGIATVLGGVFNSGILATGATAGAKFNYSAAPQEVLTKVQRLQSVCERYGVPLGAAAVQFAAAHPTVASVCLGSRTIEQQQLGYDWFATEIPGELWADLRKEGLIREDAPTP